MDIKNLIQEGNLSDARSQLVAAVKSSPADQRSRTLLFQVLAYMGEWDKAIRHLEIIAAQDSTRQTGIQVYLNLIQAEIERIQVTQNKRQSAFLPESPAYLEQYETACQKLDTQEFQTAERIFKEIDSQRPFVSGTLNGKDFNGFRDTDTRLSFFLEAFVHERYVRVPFEFLRELSLPKPQTFLDLLWTSAQITTWDGLTLNCFLPVLYPESFRHEDDRLKRGRMTDWMNLGKGFYQGVGQHVFQVGEKDIGILEIQKAVFKLNESE
jgi:type VI secretion system protein ImpE